MDVNWSELRPEMIDTIAKKITVFGDYIRFRAVCVEWCSTVPPTPQHLPCQLPWLMLPFDGQNEKHGFLDLSEKKVHQLSIPETQTRSRCCGSSHGWLVLLEEKNPTILLLNPFTRIQIQLPPITSFPNVWDFQIHNVGEEYLVKYPFEEHPYPNKLEDIHDFFIKKVILSSNPTSLDKDYIAVAILDLTKELAFCKKGDESWTIIEAAESYCEDVIYFKGLFFAVNKEGSLAICDVNHVISNVSPAVTIIAPPKPVSHADMLYLVDSFGEILLVTRYLNTELDPELGCVVYKTTGFDVFSLDARKPKWVEVKSLGDRMLFLGGENSSLCLLATDFSGCEGNCIYFTDDYTEVNEVKPGDHDMGVFNLGDRSIKPLPYFTGVSRLFYPSPIWFTPNPC
ncbi:Protein of unknown function DUF295 [Macleaya cordata]|uniref:KIB1-4 beta-propeller domain-containing protein n=1 Tax=Macleaya cordata TaxID=56857 RepID=A0A200QKB6_MACCD|nr:Protein of unknown function DUF295 [Macleaya cordata]